MVHHRVQPTQDNDDEEANEASDRSDYEQVDTDYPKARKAKSLLKSDKITLELLILVDYFLHEGHHLCLLFLWNIMTRIWEKFCFIRTKIAEFDKNSALSEEI